MQSRGCVLGRLAGGARTGTSMKGQLQLGPEQHQGPRVMSVEGHQDSPSTGQFLADPVSLSDLRGWGKLGCTPCLDWLLAGDLCS